jgi:hypothetical protein
MIRRITSLVAVAILVLALAVGPAFAKNTSSCEFERGTTTCTTVHGSMGSTDTHQGQVNSSGKDRGGGECKVTGSTHTCP